MPRPPYNPPVVFTATLHAGDPGRTGEHMLHGLLATAYAQVTGAGPGFISIEARAEFERVPPSTRPTHLGLWRGPVFIGGGEIDAPHQHWEPADTLAITAFLRFTFGAWKRDVAPA